MEIRDTKLKGVKLIIQDTLFEDHRGYYRELYSKKSYDNMLRVGAFVEDDISVSDSKGVLKGIHGDEGTWKLISCIAGKFYLVVVNCNRDHQQFGMWDSFILTPRNRVQVLVPPRFGNGHQALQDGTIFYYKQTSYYGDYEQITVAWHDPNLQIPWPINNPILSLRDSEGPFFKFESL